MGGGTSQMTTSMEDILTTTYMIGRAIAAISCPGMYRIHDFHSPLAPRLKNTKSFAFFADESDDEEGQEFQPDPSVYSNFFNVTVGEDVIYIEDPLECNESGWTPLHACCMSFMTVSAGMKIIDEIVRRGGNLNIKTTAGPGSFNKGWTALQMACAYGVEPLVERLVQEGADVNAVNCYGYNAMMEGCHRGFVNIVDSLIRGGADLSYIPSDEESLSSPFVSSPAQSPLGEAARCGFPRIVQSLLDGGARKNQSNSLGWTPLHEACFYNRAEVVKTLLLSGANVTCRTLSGALPYHLASLQMIRVMLTEMGGPDAVPEAGDTIDMVTILRELTMTETTIIMRPDGSFETKSEPVGNASYRRLNDADADENSSSAIQSTPASASKTPKANRRMMIEDGDTKASPPALLHSGGVLGDLPSLGAGKMSPSKYDANLNHILEARAGSTVPMGGLGLGSAKKSPSLKADDKKKKKKTKKIDAVPSDFPLEFLCQLSQKPMSEPVKSIYGHVFDKTVINNWFHTQGKICPLTGAPLSDVDLKELPELGEKIRDWILQKSKSASKPVDAPMTPDGKTLIADGPGNASSLGAKGGASAEDDDLYNF